MAIGKVGPGDLVIVHSAAQKLYGLFLVVAVEGDTIVIVAPDNASIAGEHPSLSGYSRVQVGHIFAVFASSSTR